MITPRHIGICVSDIQRSLKFWCQGLGFDEVRGPVKIDDGWSDALEIGGPIELSARWITKGGYTFELLQFETPRPHGGASARRDQIGLTHFECQVDDLDRAIAHLQTCGASVIASTRTKTVFEGKVVELVFVKDPDGIRVELTSRTPADGEGTERLLDEQV
jgi:lactoylglutathione lyase